MFQYTTETIINSNTGNLKDGKRFDVFEGGGAKFFIIDGVNSFKLPTDEKDAIKIRAYHSPARDEKMATATIAIDTPSVKLVNKLTGAETDHAIAKGDVIRLTVEIREQGSTRSTIQNAYNVRTKPFHYEIMVEDPTKIAEELKKVIDKDMLDTDFNYFHTDIKKAEDKKSTSGNTLYLEGDDCYIQFSKVTLDYVMDSDHLTGIAPTKFILEKVEGKTEDLTAGDPGAGTVRRLIKDLRIPTGASINPFGTDHGGMPIPGGKYDQYTIEYETPRAHVSGTVVGSVGEVSRTTHVFFVEAGAKTAWTDALKNAGIDPVEARANVATKADTGVKVGELSKHKTEKGSVQ